MAEAPHDPICAAARIHAQRHRAELLASKTCGCFFCFRQFAASEITTWIDGGQTALCPRCGIDAIVGSSSGFVISDHFLRRMHRAFFNQHSKTRSS